MPTVKGGSKVLKLLSLVSRIYSGSCQLVLASPFIIPPVLYGCDRIRNTYGDPLHALFKDGSVNLAGERNKDKLIDAMANFERNILWSRLVGARVLSVRFLCFFWYERGLEYVPFTSASCHVHCDWLAGL